jgi:hypothetical protein
MKQKLWFPFSQRNLRGHTKGVMFSDLDFSPTKKGSDLLDMYLTVFVPHTKWYDYNTS